MKLYLGAVALFSIAGMAAYGFTPAHGEQPSLVVVGAEPQAEAPPPAAPQPKLTYGRPVNEAGRVPVYRGTAVIGWVVPDPERARIDPPAPRHKMPATAAPKGPKVSSATSGPGRSVTRRMESTVYRIKNDFRTALRKPFHKKPSWSNRFTDFRDHPRHGRRR